MNLTYHHLSPSSAQQPIPDLALAYPLFEHEPSTHIIGTSSSVT